MAMSEKLYNLEFVKKLSHNNGEIIRKLINVFINQAPTSVESLKSAYYARKYAVVRQVAHKIKPTYAYFVISNTEKDIEMIELLCNLEKPLPEIETLIKRLEETTNKVVTQLREELN